MREQYLKVADMASDIMIIGAIALAEAYGKGATAYEEAWEFKYKLDNVLERLSDETIGMIIWWRGESETPFPREYEYLAEDLWQWTWVSVPSNRWESWRQEKDVDKLRYSLLTGLKNVAQVVGDANHSMHFSGCKALDRMATMYQKYCVNFPTSTHNGRIHS